MLIKVHESVGFPHLVNNAGAELHGVCTKLTSWRDAVDAECLVAHWIVWYDFLSPSYLSFCASSGWLTSLYKPITFELLHTSSNITGFCSWTTRFLCIYRVDIQMEHTFTIPGSISDNICRYIIYKSCCNHPKINYSWRPSSSGSKRTPFHVLQPPLPTPIKNRYWFDISIHVQTDTSNRCDSQPTCDHHADHWNVRYDYILYS